MNLHCLRSRSRHHFPHDNRQSDKRNETAASCQRYRQSHIAFGEHGKDIRRTPPRTTGNQHHTDEEQWREVKDRSQEIGQYRQTYNLPYKSGKDWPRTFEKQLEVRKTKREPEFEHQQGKHWNNDENSRHSNSTVKIWPSLIGLGTET